MLTVVFAIMEALHAVLHIKVLFAIGKLYSVEDLEKKRDYFVMDMMSVIASYSIIILNPNVENSDKMKLGLFALSHVTLHAFYITRWTMKNSFFVRSIMDWACEKDHLKRIAKDGKMLFAYNTIGTMFDIYVHYLLCKTLYTMKN